MRRSMLTALAITAATVALASCSSSAQRVTVLPTSAASSPVAARSQSATPDAAAVTAKLTTAIPSVKLTVTYDATSDPNGRLGRPHQYTSKTAFDDTRVSGTAQAQGDATQNRRDSISYGGTVEVFPTADDAAAWVKAIDIEQQAFSGLVRPDYMYQHGKVVARVSHLLTPDQAAAYDRAIN